MVPISPRSGAMPGRPIAAPSASSSRISSCSFENVATVARVMGVPRAQQWRRASMLLQQVGLQHRMEASPLQLSGGEQQRVAIARALMNEPSLLLADEPTGNLDRALSMEVMDIFRDINAAGTTVVMATHDEDLIAYVNRRVVRLDHGQVVGDRRPA
jgi:cell division transport system ATP-binding protein